MRERTKKSCPQERISCTQILGSHFESLENHLKSVDAYNSKVTKRPVFPSRINLELSFCRYPNKS